MVNRSFATLTHDIKSQFSALLQFRFEIHSVLQFNLPRLHSLFRSQLWKDWNNVLKTYNIFHNLLQCFYTCIIKLKLFFSFIKVKCEFWNHHTSKMGDFSLNPLTFFTENWKTYRNLAKPASISKVTPVRFYFSVKFINNTFDNFNNIYYCFLLSGAAIVTHRGQQFNKKYFAAN